MRSQVNWLRADPAALAAFDPCTKTCTHNCGPCQGDPRSAKERLYLCDLCWIADASEKQQKE